MRADVLAMAGTNLSDVPIKFPALLDLGCRLLLEVPVRGCPGPLLPAGERGKFIAKVSLGWGALSGFDPRCPGVRAVLVLWI